MAFSRGSNCVACSALMVKCQEKHSTKNLTCASYQFSCVLVVSVTRMMGVPPQNALMRASIIACLRAFCSAYSTHIRFSSASCRAHSALVLALSAICSVSRCFRISRCCSRRSRRRLRLSIRYCFRYSRLCLRFSMRFCEFLDVGSGSCFFDTTIGTSIYCVVKHCVTWLDYELQ